MKKRKKRFKKKLKQNEMDNNHSKTARQQLALVKYNNSSYDLYGKRFIMQMCTGFGKTRIGINRIKELNVETPEAITNVIVPRTNLKDDWVKEDGHIKQHNLKNVNVFVVNSYVSYIESCPENLVCDFLLLDECHRYAGANSVLFNTVVDISTFSESLALTATLSKAEQMFMINKGYKVIDIITDEEAEQEGWIAPSMMFSIGIDMTEVDTEAYDELAKRVDYYFSMFNHNFDLVKACGAASKNQIPVKFQDILTFTEAPPDKLTADQWRYWWATQQGWKGEEIHTWSPKKIAEYAVFFRNAMDERKKFIYNFPAKLTVCKQIAEEFSDKKILFFSESSLFTDKLAKSMPTTSKPFHSYIPTQIRDTSGVVIAYAEKVKQGKSMQTFYRGVKSQKLWTFEQIKAIVPKAKKIGLERLLKENLEMFEKDEISSLCAVKKLDEGYNLENINMVVNASYTSSPRQLTQRKGRGGRIDYNDVYKRAIIITLVVRGTQEEKAWFKNSMGGGRKSYSVSSVKEIVHILTQPIIQLNQPKLMFDNSNTT